MPDIEEMVLAVTSLRELEGKFNDYLNRKLPYGASLPSDGITMMSDESFAEMCVSLRTALQVLEKRIQYHQPPIEAVVHPI